MRSGLWLLLLWERSDAFIRLCFFPGPKDAKLFLFSLWAWERVVSLRLKGWMQILLP